MQNSIYVPLMYAHLATIIPCIFIGAFIFLAKKGNVLHKVLGRVYMILMLVTGLITLFMPAHVGPQFLGHFGWIHLFSLLTLHSVPKAYFAIRRGDVKTHKGSMIGLYVGGILIAGSFTFVPGRFMHQFFFG